jgi:hypothetical protein
MVEKVLVQVDVVHQSDKYFQIVVTILLHLDYDYDFDYKMVDY